MGTRNRSANVALVINPQCSLVSAYQARYSLDVSVGVIPVVVVWAAGHLISRPGGPTPRIHCGYWVCYAYTITMDHQCDRAMYCDQLRSPVASPTCEFLSRGCLRVVLARRRSGHARAFGDAYISQTSRWLGRPIGRARRGQLRAPSSVLSRLLST